MEQAYYCYINGEHVGGVGAENLADARVKAKEMFGEKVECKWHK